MKYVLYLGLITILTVSATYTIKAESIRKYILNQTSGTFGRDSPASKISVWLMDNSFYVISVRIVAGIVAISALGALVYLIAFEGRGLR